MNETLRKWILGILFQIGLDYDVSELHLKWIAEQLTLSMVLEGWALPGTEEKRFVYEPLVGTLMARMDKWTYLNTEAKYTISFNPSHLQEVRRKWAHYYLVFDHGDECLGGVHAYSMRNASEKADRKWGTSWYAIRGCQKFVTRK